MKQLLVVSSVIVGMLVSGAAIARADERAPSKPTVTPVTSVTLGVTTVYGHPQRPAAAIEVSRARMTLPATTPTLSGMSKIQDASKKDPF